MRRETSERGKVPAERIRAAVRHLDERSHEAWKIAWPAEAAEVDSQHAGRGRSWVSAASVRRGTTEWTYETLDEFLHEYTASDCDSASLVVEAWPSGRWSLGVVYSGELNRTNITLDIPAKADLLYAGEPLDVWMSEMADQRAKEEAESAEEWRKYHEDEQREKDLVAVEHARIQSTAGAKYPAWQIWRQISWSSVKDNLVSTMIWGLVIVLVAVVLLRLGVGVAQG